MSSLQRGLLMVLPFALWGTAMAAMAPLVHSGGPALVACLRLLPAGAVLLVAVPWLGRSLRIDPGDRGWFVLFTLVDAFLFQIFLAKGIEGTGAGLGSVLIDSQPLIVALLARWLFAESINPFGWLGLALGLAGIVCLGVPAPLLNHWWLEADLSSWESGWQSGTGWMLLAALTMALGTVISRFACRRSDPVAVTGWHMVFGGIPLLIWHGLDPATSMLPPWSGLDWAQMAYASILGSALAYGLFFWFANREDLTGFTTLGFLTPVFALASGGVLLGERLEGFQWLAVLLVLASVLLVSQRQKLWDPLLRAASPQPGDMKA